MFKNIFKKKTIEVEKKEIVILESFKEAWEIDSVNTKQIFLFTKPGWDTTLFFKHLNEIIPDDCILYLEDPDSKEIKEFLLKNQIINNYEYHVENNIFKENYHVMCNNDILNELTIRSEYHAAPEICMHLNIYKNNRLILEWYDAFSDPLFLSTEISEERVQLFCEKVGCKYKKINYQE